MNVTTCQDQAQCRAVLRELGCEEVFRPTPPSQICDGLVQLADTIWLVGTNSKGTLTLHFLEGFSQAEARKFFDGLKGPNTIHSNLRPLVVGLPVCNTANN